MNSKICVILNLAMQDSKVPIIIESKVIIKTNKSGLFKQRKDGTISLVDDQKEFIIEKLKFDKQN